jgi:protein LTV1
MGRKKQPFINRKNASTFHLMHRSQRDVSQDLLDEGDTQTSSMILWPSPDNHPDTNAQILGSTQTGTMQEWRAKLHDAGLLEESQDPFLKEISGTGTFLNPKGRIASAQNDIRSHPTNLQDLDMLEVKDQMDNIPLADALDEDMAAILNGDTDDIAFDEFEELNDEFIFDAAKEPETNDEAFDYDEHIRKLMEKAKLQREGGGEASDKNNPAARHDQAFFAQMKPLHEHEDEDDSFANLASIKDEEENDDDDDQNTAALTYATTPGVVPKLSPEEERALCDKFAETLLEYDSDEIGDDPYEEIGGDRPLKGDRELEAALDDFLVEKQDDILIHGSRPRNKGGGSGFSVLKGKTIVLSKHLNPAARYIDDPVDHSPPIKEVLAAAQMRLAEPHAQPPPEDVLIDGKSYFSEKIRNPWDCESILSTYSTLDNNPVTIGPGSSRRRRKGSNRLNQSRNEETVPQIQLSNKTGLPLGIWNSEGKDDEGDSYLDGNDTTISVNRGLARNKHETPEEKRARKAALKHERQVARIQKKVTREIFQEEFHKRTVGVQADDIAGKTVFRF